MAFNWNFRRQPDLANYIGAQVDPYNASRIASENMQGYRPNAAFTPGTPAEQAAAAMQGYTQNPQGGQFSVPNDMHGGMGQPDLEGYGESLQTASDAVAQAQAKEQKIASLESQIAVLEKRIADNKARLSNWTGNADKIAAIEARKINVNDPTSIWRWKEDRDNARRIANEQNKSKDTARANALIEATNTIENMVVDPSMDTPTANAMLSKLADIKSNLQKNGLPTKMVDDKIKEIKGDDKKVIPEQTETEDDDVTYEGKDREQSESKASRLLSKKKVTVQELENASKSNVSNDTKNKLLAKRDEVKAKNIQEEKDQKRENSLLGKGKFLTSEEIQFMEGRKDVKKHTDNYGNIWFTRGQL